MAKMPVMTKPQALASARSGRMAFRRYETSGRRVRVFGKTGVVTGRLQRTATLNQHRSKSALAACGAEGPPVFVRASVPLR